MNQELVTERVIEDFKARTALGLKKYGRALTTHDGRDSLQDLYEELLDAAQYIKKAMMERDAVIESCDKELDFDIDVVT